MKKLLLPAFLFLCLVSQGQYYYKDIVGTRESSDLIKSYKANNIVRVVVNSYDATDTRNEDFFVEQRFDPSERKLRTITRSQATNESVLISFSDAEGRIVRTIDSSEALTSTTDYAYDAAGKLLRVTSTTTDTSFTFSPRAS